MVPQHIRTPHLSRDVVRAPSHNSRRCFSGASIGSKLHNLYGGCLVVECHAAVISADPSDLCEEDERRSANHDPRSHNRQVDAGHLGPETVMPSSTMLELGSAVVSRARAQQDAWAAPSVLRTINALTGGHDRTWRLQDRHVETTSEMNK